MGIDRPDDVEDLLDEERREAHRRLVHAQQPGARHQRAADRHHLLLAARERPRLLLLPLGEPREQRVDAVEVTVDGLLIVAVLPLERPHEQVLEHGHSREEATALRRLRDAALDDVVR